MKDALTGSENSRGPSFEIGLKDGPREFISRGSSTFEILIAFAVLTLTFTAVISVVFGNQSISVDAQVSHEAIAMAERNLEVARAAAKADFYGLADSSVVTTSGPLVFTDSMTFIDVASFVKKATSNVSWQNSGRTLSVAFSTLLTDPHGYQSGDTCSPALAGDWTHPLGSPAYGYFDYPDGENVTAIDVAGGRAYVTTDPSSGADDLYIVDVRDPNPSDNELPTVGSYSTGLGLTDVRISGSRAYVTAHSATAQLLVLNVADPNDISVISQLDVTQSGDSAYGHVFYYDHETKRVYLGLTKSSGKEFRIIDVSDPAAPVMRGGFEVGSAINQVVVSNNSAYLATASSSQQVIVLDITDPDNPMHLRSFVPSPSPLTGASLLLSDNTLYFGRAGGGSLAHTYPQLYSLRADTLAVNWTHTTATPGNYNGVNRMVLRSNLLFVAAANQNGGFEIWDVSNPPNPPTRHDDPYLSVGSLTGLDCEGNLLFAGEAEQLGFHILGPS